ncbi:diguanylate cyclase [Pseudomaricurvus alcaniphilus]|uniref:diguanylate cyclase n=1 Tax=Pseudomaricurvus alcaniphilus TaxID=1166482 RepID=UPI00140E4A79|nr:diguanylate cyclase [Pseudomaricurvus alcaniphilus]NHN38740.1 diguanylate cyclase [Pseudomaricurvus alcaniphilus]
MLGESFNQRIKAGLNIGNKLSQRLADEAIDLGQGESITQSVSAGLATLEQDKLLENFVSRADGALYEAKRGGRDQVRSSDA